VEKSGTSRAMLALRIGVLAALTLIGAVFAYRHIADASSQGPIPAAKRDREAKDASRRFGRRAPKPSDTRAPRPAQSSTPGWEKGIVDDDESPSSDYAIRNRWVGTVHGSDVVVFAGASASDASQGLVVVQQLAGDGSASDPQAFVTPTKAGPVHVTTVHGSRVTLVADDGTTFTFDAATLRFD